MTTVAWHELGANPAPLCDRGYLHLLQEVMGSLPFDELLASFRAKAIGLASALRSRPPPAELGRLAHQLSGSAGMFGLGELGQRARQLELAVLADDAELGPLVEACLDAIMRSLAALDAWSAVEAEAATLPDQELSPGRG